MNWSKNTIISTVIIIVTFLVGVVLVALKNNYFVLPFNTSGISSDSIQLRFTEKNFKLNSSSYQKDILLNIANFEEIEDWNGDGIFDDVNPWEGEYSLLLESRDNVKKEASILEKLDLSKYPLFQLAIDIETDPEDIELARLYFGNKDKSAYYFYPITNLKSGWNFLQIPKIKFSVFSKDATPGGALSWAAINRLGIELASRYNSSSSIKLDNLVSIQNDAYLDDWLTSTPQILSLGKNSDNQTVLQAKNIGGSVALIKKISSVTDFAIKMKLQPLKVNARSGIFIRGDYKTGNGYYFFIDGLGGNRWQILKVGKIDESAGTTILKNGVINNFIVENKKPLWLKVQALGNNFKFYLSIDGKSYTLLGEVTDGEFKEGGVGIAVYDGGVTQFDEMEFSQ